MDNYVEGRTYKYYSYKYDGMRIRITNNSKGERVFMSRGGHLIDLDFLNLPSINSQDDWYGELYYPGKPASYVRTAIIAKDTKLQYRVWCIAHLCDTETLHYCKSYCEAAGFQFVEYGLFDETNWKQLPPNCDGYVFRDGNNWNLAKWKPIKTIDVVVTNVTEGKNKYEDQIGALVCTVEGVEVAKCSGMTDEVRLYFTKNPPVGKVIEIAYDKMGAKGRCIWPRFKRIRDDKLPEECLLSQDADLEEYWNARSVKKET